MSKNLLNFFKIKMNNNCIRIGKLDLSDFTFESFEFSGKSTARTRRSSRNVLYPHNGKLCIVDYKAVAHRFCPRGRPSVAVVVVAVLFSSGFTVYCGNQFVRFQLRLEQMSINEMDLQVHYSKIFVISVRPKLLIGLLKHTITDVSSVTTSATMTYLIFDLSSYFPFLFHAKNSDNINNLPHSHNLDERAWNPLSQRSQNVNEQSTKASKLSTWSLYELSTSTAPIFSFSPSHNNLSFGSGPQVSSLEFNSRSHVMLNRRAFSFTAASVESSHQRNSQSYFTRQYLEVTLQETLSHMIEAIELPHHFASDLAVDDPPQENHSTHLYVVGDLTLLPSLSNIRTIGRNIGEAEHVLSQMKSTCPLSYAIPNSHNRTSHTLVVSMDCEYCRLPSLLCVPTGSDKKQLCKLGTYNCFGEGCQHCSSSAPYIASLSAVALNIEEQVSNFDELLPIPCHLIVVEYCGQGNRVLVYSMFIVKCPVGEDEESHEKEITTSGDSDDLKDECDSVWKDVGELNVEVEVSDYAVNTSNDHERNSCQEYVDNCHVLELTCCPSAHEDTVFGNRKLTFVSCNHVAGLKLVQYCLESVTKVEGKVKLFEIQELELLLEDYLVHKKCMLVALECSESIDSTYNVRQNILLNIYSIAINHTSHEEVPLQQSKPIERRMQQSNPICAIDVGSFLAAEYSPTLSAVSICVSMLSSFMILITFDPHGTNAKVYVIRIGDMTLTQSFMLPADDMFQSVEHTLSADVWNAMHYSEEDILFFAQGFDETTTNQSAFVCKSLEHRYLELFIVMKHGIYCVYEEMNEMRDTSTVHVTKKFRKGDECAEQVVELTRILSSPVQTNSSSNTISTFLAAKNLYSLISGTDYRTDIIYGQRKYKEQTYSSAIHALFNASLYILDCLQQRHVCFVDGKEELLSEHIQEVVTFCTLWQLMYRNQMQCYDSKVYTFSRAILVKKLLFHMVFNYVTSNRSNFSATSICREAFRLASKHSQMPYLFFSMEFCKDRCVNDPEEIYEMFRKFFGCLRHQHAIIGASPRDKDLGANKEQSLLSLFTHTVPHYFDSNVRDKMIIDLLLNSRYFFCKNVATLKWQVEFHIHSAQSLFYLLLKLRRKLSALKSIDRHTSTALPSPTQSDIQLKIWQDPGNVRFLLTVMDVLPFVLVKLLTMVMQSIRDHANLAASVPALQLLKSMLKPLLYPTHARERAASAYHLYAEVSDCLSRVLSKVDRVAPLFTAGTSSFNEMRILLTVLRQSMATSIHSLVSIFEYFSTYVRPSQLSVLFVGGTTQRFGKIRPEIPAREEPTAPYSTRRSRTDAALIVSTLQGLMWQLSSPSTKVMLLPIATLLFDAMQRLTSPSPIVESALRAQDIGDCGGYGGNEYLVAGFMCVLHAIEELHAVDMAAVKLAMESLHPALESTVKTSTVLQLLDGLEWLVCRDSLRLENNYKNTRRQVGFALGQLLSLWLSLSLPVNLFEERALLWVSTAAGTAVSVVPSAQQERKALLVDALCSELLFDKRTQIHMPRRLHFSGAFLLFMFKWHYNRCQEVKNL